LETTTAQQRARAPESGEEVRVRILDAATNVFAERGYAAATTREIAARAGIGKRMLFYYFASKESVYRAVLERMVMSMVAIHEQFRAEPGPVGLADAAEGVTRFAAANLPALKVLLREIIDDGPCLPELVHDVLGPLFGEGSAEVARNMETGVFRRADPMHVLLNVGGLTLFYFLNLPLLSLLWDRDPLAPATLDERVAVVRDCLTHGLVGPGAKGRTSP
jgi:TetR/AcrR family transcriptional regulator